MTSHWAPSIPKVDWGVFTSFTESARINDIKGLDFPIPRPEKCYNDDVELPLYEGALRSYQGSQRKGIRDEHPDATTVEAHIESALKAPFFLGQQTPLPGSIKKSIDFVSSAPAENIKEFWKKKAAESY